VIAANHASFLDGLLLGAFLPGDPIFAVDTLIAKQWWAKPFLMFVNALPVDPTNPLSIRSMIRAVEGGSACIIFPEGRITTTGSLMKVYEGPAVIAGAHKGGIAASPHRRCRVHAVLAALGKVRRRWFPRIHIRILPPRMLAAPEGVSGRARARRCGARSATRWCSRCLLRRASIPRCFDALLEARYQHGGSHVAADDLEMRPLTYRGPESPRATRSEACSLGERSRANASACCCRPRARRSSRSLRCRRINACRRC
jgi:acyl-[acyl-carrier-protein]-phospholipid O-acyltransferase/long-chain-fatty-acid--[acyl-carrier-protein] ligase